MTVIGRLAAVVALALAAGCGSGAEPAPRAAAARDALTVRMSGSQFAPASATVARGASVTFVNDDGVSHTVTATAGAEFDSGALEPGGSFRVGAAGTIAYACTLHPGMTGALRVR